MTMASGSSLDSTTCRAAALARSSRSDTTRDACDAPRHASRNRASNSRSERTSLSTRHSRIRPPSSRARGTSNGLASSSRQLKDTTAVMRLLTPRTGPRDTDRDEGTLALQGCTWAGRAHHGPGMRRPRLGAMRLCPRDDRGVSGQPTVVRGLRLATTRSRTRPGRRHDFVNAASCVRPRAGRRQPGPAWKLACAFVIALSRSASSVSVRIHAARFIADS